MPRSEDAYGSQGSVPTERNQGVSNAGLNVRADADAFGAGVGKAISGAGKEVQDMGNHFAQMASEAKVNDDYANKYVPAAANLRTQYDMLQGQDKVAGYDNYINGLQDLNKQFTAAQPGLYGQRAMSAAINRHVEGEVFGAKRELVASQIQYANKSSYDVRKANIKMAAQNYNNPELVQSYEEQNNNHVLINHIDNGSDPNNPVHANLIKQAQDNGTGELGVALISSSIKAGDTQSANQFRSKYASLIPGHQQVAIDNELHTANIQQSSQQGLAALKIGAPLPETIGTVPSQIRAVVADTAKTSGIDPNHALTVLSIECPGGQCQNGIGPRHTLGQDKESEGKTTPEQAKTLCDNLKVAATQTTNALGRTSEPWESYVTYQQGAAGGPALLKAAQDNPDTKAIEVLSKFYDDPAIALKAINGNGGNPTMSASDFVDHIHQVWDSHASRSDCDFTNIENPGETILKPHQTSGPTLQPAATPIQEQVNFEKMAPQLIDSINSIPNYAIRAGQMQAFKEDRAQYADKATAYKNVITHEALQAVNDPNFVNLNQLKPDALTAIQQDLPQLLPHIEAKMKDNRDKQSGKVTKEQKEWGTKSFDVYKAIANGEITTPAQIMARTTEDGSDLTVAGADHMISELQKNNKPENASDNQMKKLHYEYAKSIINPYKSPEAQQKFNDYYIQTEATLNKAVKEGKSLSSLLTSTSPDYVGKAIQQFSPSQTQLMASKVEHEKAEAKQIADEVQKFNTMSPNLFPEYFKNAKDALAKPSIDEATKKQYSNTLLNLEIVAARRGLARPRTIPVAE